MGLILRSKDTPEKLFREVVDTTMSSVLEECGFESMSEILERGNTDKAYKKTPSETANELLKSCGYDGKDNHVGIDKMFDKNWDSGRSKVHNYVWQRVYLEIFNSISETRKLSQVMKDFSNQIASEYGIAVWNAIFDKYQKFFVMIWRMNVSYSCSNSKQRKLIFLIKGFYKSINKASRELSKELEKVDFDNSNVYVLEGAFEKLFKEIRQDKVAFAQMIKISNYFAKDFGKMLWYGRFSELQRFIIVCSEVNRAQKIIMQ